METLKKFYDFGIPHLTKQEQERFKRHLFSISDLLSFKLEDRFDLLQDFLGDRKLKSFLTFLYNHECDDFRRNYLQYCYGECSGSPEDVYKHVANIAQDYEDQKIFALSSLSKKIKVLYEIGYEKYFYDLKDELLFYCLLPLNLTFEECFIYYGKSSSKWLSNLESLKLQSDILNNLHTLYNNSHKKSIATLLILKLISCDVYSSTDQRYHAYVENKKLFINEKAFKEIRLELLLHEACHLLHSYEDRFQDFFVSFSPFINPNEITESWASIKERCINQFIRTHCYLKNISRSINDFNALDTLSITDSVTLDLKQKSSKDQIWK